MKEGPDISQTAALIGDPARANILTALMAGKALTASELAGEAGITLQTTSGHLRKLEDGALIIARKQGRHKYFALATPDVAELLEALMGFASAQGHLRTRTGPRDAEMRNARICYNHLAGEAGVQIFDSMLARNYLAQAGEDLSLTDSGAGFMAALGLDLERLKPGRAPLCRSCLDWSERRSHLGGLLGRALFDHMQEKGWISRDKTSRIVRFQPKGRLAFDQTFTCSD